MTATAVDSPVRRLDRSLLCSLLCSLVYALVCSLAVLLPGPVHADDGKGLQRGASPDDVGISGVSAGAAMALQYAVAHSASVTGVGAIAGPPWGCAEGLLSKSINACMCGRQPIAPKADVARSLARERVIDPLDASGRPRALKRAYVFQSASDATVVKQSGDASLAFLREFVGPETVADSGNAADGSDAAMHGIVSPEGTDQCGIEGGTDSYIRKCGAEDNAGKLLRALKAPGTRYDASLRQKNIPESDVWTFRQQPFIDAVKTTARPVSGDLPGGRPGPQRANFDMAEHGYLYVPPVCRKAGSRCDVHVALHGCRQDPRQFAIRSGYNNWAEHYRTIIVYPAMKQGADPLPGNICRVEAFKFFVPPELEERNPNGCWDWWGYLEAGWPRKPRYYTRDAPQIQVIERIIFEVTRPIAQPGG